MPRYKSAFKKIKSGCRRGLFDELHPFEMKTVILFYLLALPLSAFVNSALHSLQQNMEVLNDGLGQDENNTKIKIRIPFLDKPQTPVRVELELEPADRPEPEKSQKQKKEKEQKDREDQVIEAVAPTGVPTTSTKAGRSLLQISESISEEELIAKAVAQAVRNNTRIRREKVQTKQIMKAIERNRIPSNCRSSFPSSEYPFMQFDIFGRVYYNANGGQTVHSASIDTFIKRNLSDERSGFIPEISRFLSDAPSKRRRH